MHLRDILPGCPVPFANNPEVDRFEFGSRYAALMRNGARVEFDDFDAAARSLESALIACPTTTANTYVAGRVLVVRIDVELGRPWGRNVQKLLQDLRFAVGHQMMTGEWPDDLARFPKQRSDWRS